MNKAQTETELRPSEKKNKKVQGICIPKVYEESHQTSIYNKNSIVLQRDSTSIHNFHQNC